MKLVFVLLTVGVCFASDTQQVPANKRIAYWKLRAEIAEQNAAFAASLTAEQKRTLEIVRAKSSELKALQDDISKSCGSMTQDVSGEPVCAASPEQRSK